MVIWVDSGHAENCPPRGHCPGFQTLINDWENFFSYYGCQAGFRGIYSKSPKMFYNQFQLKKRGSWMIKLKVRIIAGCLGWYLAVSGMAVLSGCSRGQSNASLHEMKAPVKVAVVQSKDIPVEVSEIGAVEAISSVEIKSQVTGYLTGIYFQEGQEVKGGDLLFQIDPRPYQNNLAQLQANLAKDRSQMENAQVESDRYDQLIKKDLISKEQSDQVRTNWEALKGVVKSDQAALRNASLQLSYCAISAPIAGRTGALFAHKGDLVKENDTGSLVVINQLQPIYVSFAVPEQYLAEIRKYNESGELEVLVSIPGRGSAGPELAGKLSFIDNAVDRATGTIRLKATFANEQELLWPGQFVDSKLKLSTRKNATVVSGQAVQTGQNGQYVYVVKPDLSVEMRPVVSSGTVNDDAVIEKGLVPGEKVVTDGQLRLFPGAKVEIQEPQTPKGN